MKRIIIILFIVLLSVPVFAELNLELGPCVFLDFAIPLKALSQVPPGAKHLGIEDLVIGADLELIFGMLQFGAIATFNPAAEWEVDGEPIQYPAFINLGLDGGILISILILRLGIGAGPTMRIPIIHKRPDKPLDLGINVKGNVDLDIGGIVFRLNVATFLDLIQMTKQDAGGLSALPVFVGVSVLFEII